ncbi:orotidine 5'-phosphate decarboxylase [Neokomagataea thailandica NBRC 106555]|uniref:Orotidine 5'-phosphate decarboxylase n=2 Tax=Neokomagataea TaxID=1223423 RepID=A0A4Y6V609_9PROT|nr:MULTISPECIES: orotidine-5'-phosphate decarboxylase [Neokomagataea]QDH25572.1 orotidine-5'-phosphate decarboxylase [Neokomagataea tanensis]GBR52657.1 orotidine 5'-phosphate decarboxylase [Neokomagataea thailandica NBRC 106555]
MSHRTRLIAALDTQSVQQAELWAQELSGTVDALKLGLEFTYSCGLDVVREFSQKHPLFLDLKLHDIPNTVAGGLSALRDIKPKLLTIHASGGRAMIERAKAALEEAYPDAAQRPILLAVTVLTSMNETEMHELGVSGTVRDQVSRLGKMAISAGADGLVCSPQEIDLLRQNLGSGPALVVPGIRPAGAASDDQKRIMTPAQAAKAGADWIVVGRPITRSENPAATARAIQEELQAV